MYPYFRWIYTRTFVALSTGLMLAAITLVVSHWSEFYAKLPEFQSFFNWWTIFTFWISLAVVKIIHEFGHGLTAKHFGGEVHEMGMLFLVLTPALYCDVTDSWLLPNKWHRIWISAAGIYVELFLAALATFVWFNTEQVLLNSLSMAVMFICSVNTVLFNANPLLRYDGYYVMSDWLEIPNLRIKSTQFFTYLLQEKVLGLEVPVQSYLPRSRRTLFVTYAITSYLYRWVVTFSILFFLSQFLKPYKLQSLSYMLALGSLVPLLAMPVYQMGKFFRTPGRMRKVKKARAAAFAAAFAAVVALILLIPTPLRVQGTLVLSPAQPIQIYSEVEGQLVDMPYRDGAWVKEGEVVAKLINREKQKELIQRQSEHDVYARKALWYNQSTENEGRALAQQNAHMADELEPSLAKISEQLGKLVLVAPKDGQVIGLPDPETLGQWVKPGKPFCEVADPHHMEAHLIIDQSDIDLIHLDGKVNAWVKVYGRSEATIKSQVAQIAKRNREEIPAELSNTAGGEIAAKPDPKTGQIKPQSTVYEVVIPVDNPNLEFHPGQRGFAKIDAGTHTFGWWLWRLLTKTFHFTI